MLQSPDEKRIAGEIASRFLRKLGREFIVTVEVVPPASSAGAKLAERVSEAIRDLEIDGMNLADSPMACAKMSPLLFAGALRPLLPATLEIIPHITVRDRNRVALQGMLWGAVAAGVRVVLVVSGDPVRYSNDPNSRLVADWEVPDLVRAARQEGLTVGVVFDPRPAWRATELRKLERKMAAGANFVITQPLYRPNELHELARDLAAQGAPALLGVLPLVSWRHAHFLDQRVPGIAVPPELLDALQAAGEKAVEVGIAQARAMARAARQCMAGICIMPPFHRFALLREIMTR